MSVVPFTASAGPHERTQRNLLDARGLIYFVQCGRGPGKPIKIGWASKLERRLAVLQLANPYPLIVLATMNGSRRDEAALHERFAFARKHGEWFHARPQLTAFIFSLPGRR